jgi:hypothetical protein
MHSPAAFPPRHTSLVVVDSLSTLVDNALPRNVDSRNKNEQSRWAAGRRFTIINELISTFSRFAALHDIALLVTCQTITRIRGASRALLVPAISGVEWENGVSTRLVLFRDWVRQGKTNDTADANRLRKSRFAGLVKLNGVALAEEGGVGSVVPFAIENVSQSIARGACNIRKARASLVQPSSADTLQSGLCDISIGVDNIAAPIVLPIQARPPKRPFAEVEEDAGEEPNSDELYGWIEDDEVAAEGLLIEEGATIDNAEPLPEGRSTKIARPSTI